jgi:hypothetical protein
LGKLSGRGGVGEIGRETVCSSARRPNLVPQRFGAVGGRVMMKCNRQSATCERSRQRAAKSSPSAGDERHPAPELHVQA